MLWGGLDAGAVSLRPVRVRRGMFAGILAESMPSRLCHIFALARFTSNDQSIRVGMGSKPLVRRTNEMSIRSA